VLGEPFTTPLELRGGNFITRPGYLASKGVLAPPTGIDEPASAPVVASRLTGSWPNPFNPSTTVHFEIAKSGSATLRVYDVQGRLVRTLVDGPVTAGRHEIRWDGRSNAGRSMPSGVYLLEMAAGGYHGRHKMILAR
jgi:hypothetical protein